MNYLNYKWSHFNIETLVKDEVWICNTFYGGIIKLNQHPADLAENEKLVLASYGFLVHSDCDEVLLTQELLEKNKYQTNDLLVTIAPTLGCNFSCSYCFERATESWISKQRMSLETQNQLIAYIASNLSSRNRLCIRWFGGEPLLAPEIIYKVSNQLFDLCSRVGIQYHSTIQTNGFLLSSEHQDHLLKCHVDSIQVTLDGDEEDHNRVRFIGREKQSTFSTILTNIQSAAQNFALVIRVNISPRNISSIPNLLEKLAENENVRRATIYFHPIYRLFNGKEEISVATANGFSSVREYAEQEIKLIQYAHTLGFSWSWGFSEPINLPCSALKVDGLMIDVTGSIIKCDHEMGVQSAAMGTVATGISDLEKLASWSSVNPRNNPLCPSCKILPTCLGNCESIRRRVSPEEACPSKKYNFLERLRLGIQELERSSPLQQTDNFSIFKYPSRTPSTITNQFSLL